MVAATGVTAAVAMAFTPSAGSSVRSSAPMAAPRAQTAGTSWLETLNAYRLSVGLPTVTDDPTLQTGVDNHARYLAATGSIAHSEEPQVPQYTPSGAAAAAQSLVGGWSGRDRTDRELIEDWMIAPFHAIHILEPRFQRSAFGVARNNGGRLDTAATLNVVAGIGPRVSIAQPVVFPGPRSTVPLSLFRTESPDPLTHCPGYSAPTGLPLIALFPSAPSGTTVSLTSGGAAVAFCLIDTGYRNPDAAAQRVGRLLLTQKNAVIVLPRSPLAVGATYDVTVNGGPAGVAHWSFSVSGDGASLPLPASPIGLKPVSTRSAKAQPKATVTAQSANAG